MTLQTKKLTYQEYLAGPELEARYDIIDGEMIMAPGATYTHQAIQSRIHISVGGFVLERQLGEILSAPLDIIVQQAPLRTRQPDLMFISNENRGIIGDFIHGPPDLVVEILSPSDRRSYLESKLADYASIGVQECWLISPQARTVEVLRLEQGTWKRFSIVGLGENVESIALAELVLPVAKIFAE